MQTNEWLQRGIRLALCCSVWTAAIAGPVIDTSPDRAKTDLNPGLERIGTIRPRGAREIASSNWTLGCETVDRDYADYHAYKEYLEPLGIKKIRFQAGWEKCEKVPGVYDFKWIDDIVADAASRGIEVWMELSYGNRAYKGGGGANIGGGFPTSAEGLAAWDKWVEAMVTRYKGKVREWEIWNEPHAKHPAEVTAEFNVRTARIILRADPAAKIAGLVSGASERYLAGFLARVQELEGLNLFTWLTYHGYPRNPDDLHKQVEEMQLVLEKYPTKALLRQGESGCPSEWQNLWALKNYQWSELTQAKWNLRRMLGDLGRDIETSIFKMIDMVCNDKADKPINRKGLLRATPDKKVEKIKLAYYAVQNTVAVFDHSLSRATNAAAAVECDRQTECFVYQDKATGRQLLTLWDRSGIPSDNNATTPANVAVKGCTIKHPVWVDLISGRIYAFPAERLAREGNTVVFRNVPVYDAPVLIAEQSLVLR